MRLGFLLFVGVASCSLLFPSLLPETCNGEGPLECDETNTGLISCREGFETEEACASALCDPSGPRCIECGDGVLDVQTQEECDDGNTTDGDGCDAACVVERCGDGILNNAGATLEECDDGNNVDGDGCSGACIDEFCGDGTINDTAEQCDDANAISGDGCSATCQLEIPLNCGDGILDAGEQCDDNNNQSGDGCAANCVLEVCGDGLINNNGAEACDDGNTNPQDGCEADCSLICGQGSGAVRATLDANNGHCYLGFDVRIGWQEAEADCEARGGYLTVIDDAAENTLARLASLSFMGPWIGFNDIQTEAFTDPFGFIKVTGGNLTFHNFEVGEPNNAGPFVDEDCVHFFTGSSTWNDLNCENDLGSGAFEGYLCELEPQPCGDGVVQSVLGEACDGQNLAGETCVSQGIAAGGTLACAADCSFDTTGCLADCGDGAISGAEECDDGGTASGDGCSSSCTIERAESEVNDTFAQADAFVDPFIGEINPSGDVDFISVVVASPNTVIDAIVIDPTGVGTPCEALVTDTDLTIFDTDGVTPLAFNDDILFANAANDNYCSHGVVQVATPGTYFIRLRETAEFFTGKTFLYRLQVTLRAPVCGNGFSEGEQCDDGNTTNGDGCSSTCQNEPGHFFESEFNHVGIPQTTTDNFSATNADVLPGINLLIHGDLTVFGDEDVYALTNPTAAALTLLVQLFEPTVGVCAGTATVNGTSDPFLSVQDAAGVVLNTSNDEGLGLCPLLNLTLAANQTVFLDVLDNGDDDPMGAYLLSVSACGDNNVLAGEQCDGANLGGQSCATVNPATPNGTLSCDASCAFNTSQCIP